MAQRFLGIQRNQCFALFQRRRLCNDVFSTLADEFDDFGAVFGTALKERNQTIGYMKYGGISAYRKAFLLFWRWIFKEKTKEIWSWLFFTTWFSWIMNFIIKFNNAFTSILVIFGRYGFKSGRQSRAAKIQPFVYLHQCSLQQYPKLMICLGLAFEDVRQ